MAKAEKTTTDSQDPLYLAEIERLKRDIYRPDMEKLQLFTKMLRQNAILKKAVIRHK
jgi:hypothetical protein